MLKFILLSLFILCHSPNHEDKTFAELIIKGPVELKNTIGAVWGRPALFGMPQYNGDFTGVLRYNTANKNGCVKHNEGFFDPYENTHEEVIALIDRGECHFVDKVYYAQIVGAKGVVIINNIETDWLPFMADDGYGGAVDIPSIIITKSQGDILKNHIITNVNSMIEAEIEWGLSMQGVVDWQLFTSTNPSSTEVAFIEEFRDVIALLADKQTFQPQYFMETFMYGSASDCVNNGKYCADSILHHDDTVTIPGADLIMESLRRLCIHKVGIENNDKLLWWDYTILFHHTCNTHPENCWTDAFHVETLSGLENADSGIRIDLVNKVLKCIEDSGGFDAPINPMLQESSDAFEDYEVTWRPRVTINGDFYAGSFLCKPINVETCSVLNAMCSTFPDGEIPDLCESNFIDPNTLDANNEISDGIMQEPRIDDKNTTKLRTMIILLTVIIILLAVFGFASFYWFKTRIQQTETDFRAIRNIYEPLGDNLNVNSEDPTLNSAPIISNTNPTGI